MIKSIKKFVGRTAVVIAVIVAAYVGWRWGSAVFPQAEALLGIDRPEETAPDPTPEISGEAMARLEAFAKGEESELQLEGVEVSALLRHAIPGLLPPGVVEPLVLFRGDGMEFHAKVVPASIPELPDLGPALAALPDTVPVEVRGTLMPFGEKGSVFLVTRMQVKGVPLPRRIYEDVLGSLGRRDLQGLPPEGVQVPVPDGIRGAFVQDGVLVLIRR